MTTVAIRPMESGTAFGRYVKGLRFGHEYARAQFPEHPQVARALEARWTKGAVVGMTTADVPGLDALGVFDPATALLLAGDSAFEAARPRMSEVPFQTATPRELDAGTGGGWIPEGASTPVIKSGLFDPLRLKPARIGSITVFADELLRAPGSETVIRRSVLGAQGRAETRAFLDPNSFPTSATPGSITFDAPPIPWTGIPAIDLVALFESITTSGKGLVVIVRPTTMAILAAGLGGAADAPRTLLGVPILLAPNAPAGLVVVADLAEIAYAADAIDVSKSTEATLQMADDPTNSIADGSPLAPVPTSLVSLFQGNATGFKTSRFANWSKRDGSVAYTIATSGSPA